MIIDGKATARHILSQLQEKIRLLQHTPRLAVVLVGEHGPSTTYVRQKRLAAERIGIEFCLYSFREDIGEQELLQEIEKLNNDPSITGFMVQLPLSPHINKDRIINTISPEKDVDGFTPYNIGKLFLGQEGLLSCTPK